MILLKYGTGCQKNSNFFTMKMIRIKKRKENVIQRQIWSNAKLKKKLILINWSK
jgi:hypothetical protein